MAKELKLSKLLRDQGQIIWLNKLLKNKANMFSIYQWLQKQSNMQLSLFL
jgi:hypothetical protein